MAEFDDDDDDESNERVYITVSRYEKKKKVPLRGFGTESYALFNTVNVQQICLPICFSTNNYARLVTNKKQFKYI